MTSSDAPFYNSIKKIGIGFDIFGRYREESSTEEIFDWQNIPTRDQEINGKTYAVPICATVQPAPKSEDDHETCDSLETLSNSFAVNAGAETNIGAFKGEIRTAYTEESSSSVKRYFSYYHHYEETLYLQIGTKETDYLRQAFRDDIDGALGANGEQRRLAFAGVFDHWGTHYIKSCRLGGQLDCNTSLEQSEKTSHAEMSLFVKAEYDAAFVSGEVDVDSKYEESWKSYHSSRRTHVSTVGGKHAPTSSDFENPSEETVAKFNTWIDTVYELPGTVHFELEGLWELYHESDDGKREAIEKAYMQYVTDLRSAVTVKCRDSSCFMVIAGGPDITEGRGSGFMVVIMDRNDTTKEPIFQKWYENSGDDMHYKEAAVDIDIDEHHGKLVFLYTSEDTKPNDELPIEFVRVLTECGAGTMLDQWDAASKDTKVRYVLAGVLHEVETHRFSIEFITEAEAATPPLKAEFYVAKDKYAEPSIPSFF